MKALYILLITTIVYSFTFFNNSYCSNEKYNYFDASFYNNLPDVEENHFFLQEKGNLKQCLKSLTKELDILCPHLSSALGVRLIHKHFTVKEGEEVVEYTNNENHFVTKSFYSPSNAFPASWIITSDKLLVFEKSLDSQVKKIYKEITMHPEILEKMITVIKNFQLETLLAPSIQKRKNYYPVHSHKKIYMLESTEISEETNSMYNILKFCSLQDYQAISYKIRTSWTLKGSIQHGCTYRHVCQPGMYGHARSLCHRRW